MTPVRYGMVGGGRDAFIGAVHRKACALDGEAVLVAGALSSDPEKSRASGADLGLDPSRAYGSWAEMLEGELALPESERVQMVSVVTPNHVHFDVALAFVEGAVLLGVLTLLPAAVEAAGAGAALAGAVTGVYGVAVVIFARLVGSLSRRLPTSRLIALGASSALAGCALAAVSRSAGVAVGVAILLGLAWAAMHSSLQTWATELLPTARATVVSLFAGSLFIGSAVAAVVVAGLAEANRYAVIFAGAALLTIPLGLIATRGRARWRRPGTGSA